MIDEEVELEKLCITLVSINTDFAQMEGHTVAVWPLRPRELIGRLCARLQ